MARSIPRIPIFSMLSLLFLVTVIVLWSRSPRHADVLTFYTPSGKLAGLASDRQGLLLCTTEIPFSNEMGLSAQTMSASRDEFAAVHDLLFDPSNEKWHFLGFHTATGTLGSWNWKFSALIVPYWVLVIPLALLPLTGFRRVIVRRRRKRRGQCLACGYDLRQSPDRCPECGKPVGTVSGAKSTERTAARPKITPAGALSWLVLGFLIAACVSGLARGRRAAAVAATNPPEQAVFRRMIGPVDLQNATPVTALRAVARAGKTRVELSGVDFNSVEDWPHSRLELKSVSLETALRVTCLPRCWAVGEPLQLWTSGTTVHVSPASQAPRTVRCYPVDRILAVVQTDLDRAAEDEKLHAPSNMQGGVSNQLFTGAGYYFAGPQKASDCLATLITSTLREDDWVDNGGSIGTLWIGAGRLWVFQTQEGHAAVRTFLAMLQGADQAATEPTAAEDHADLDQIIPELKLESTTLEQAIDTLRDTTRTNIVVYWNDLEQLGVKRNAPIRVHLWHVSLDRALGVVLTLAGADYPSTRAVQDGIIIVARPERLRNGINATRMYDIRDLIEKYCSESRLPTATTQSAPTTGPSSGVPSAPTSSPTFEEMADNFTKLIEDTVDTDSWKDNGGSVGTVRELAGRLIITQTPSAHRQIVDLLRTLRNGISKEGTELPETRPELVH